MSTNTDPVLERGNPTVRELMPVAAHHNAFAGSATTSADRIHEWMEAGAAGGFNITFADAADSLDVFVAEPAIARRGVRLY